MPKYREAPDSRAGMPDGSSKLAGADYFIFFTLLMLVTAILFVLVARYYRGESFLHEEQAALPD